MIAHSRPWITPEDQLDIMQTLRDECISQYRCAASLQQMLLERTGAEFASLHGSGTMALFAALKHLDLPAHSAVGLPAYVCWDVARAVFLAGFQPWLVDCTDEGLMSPEALEAALGRGAIAALIVVHPFGLIDTVAGGVGHRIPVIEDCAHVPPAFYRQDSKFCVGSFEGTKLLGAGEGGYLLGRGALPEQPLYAIKECGRCSDLVATLAINQLLRLDENLRLREHVAMTYDRVWPAIGKGRARAVWFRYHIRMSCSEAVEVLTADAQAEGILIRRPVIFFESPISNALYQRCPNALHQGQTRASIPLYPALSESELDTVCAFLARWKQKHPQYIPEAS